MKRFEVEDPDKSVIIREGTNVEKVIQIINELRDIYPNICPGDIAVIVIDDDKEIYPYMDTLASAIKSKLNWDVLRGHEEKKTDPNSIYLTNTNNVKGLEFPFVICVTSAILPEIRYRNKIYTMLTRSFISTYLLVRVKQHVNALEGFYEEIDSDGCIKDILIPTPNEEHEIRQNLIAAVQEKQISWEEQMELIFENLGIGEPTKQAKIKKAVLSTNIDKFDSEKVKQYIKIMLDNNWI